MDRKIEDIEQTYLNIHKCCEDELYYPPKEYQECSQRILNTANILFNKALSLFRNDTKVTNLTMPKITEILHQMLKVLITTDNMIEKQERIEQILAAQKLDPKSYLKLEKWEGNFLEEPFGK